MRFCFME